MKVMAAVLREPEQLYSVEELELCDPGPGELVVRVAGAGLCHTDLMPRVAWSGLGGEVGHRRSFRLVEGWWGTGAAAQGVGRSARKRRRRRLLETTKTLDRPIDAPAMSGLRSPAAARGMAATL